MFPMDSVRDKGAVIECKGNQHWFCLVKEQLPKTPLTHLVWLNLVDRGYTGGIQC